MVSYSNTPQGNGLMAASVLLLLLVSIIVPARFYVRIKVVRSFGSDDWATLVATLLSNSFCCLVIVGLFYGFGQHIGKVPPDDYTIGMMISWITQLIYIASICMTKVSVSLFIRRLTPDRSYSRIAALMMIFMVTYSNVCWWFILIQCHPFEYIWDKSGHGTCLDPSISIFMAYMHTAANILTDFLLLGLVIVMMWNVKMVFRRKLAIYGVFALGTLASVASVIKIPLSADYGKKGDFLFDVSGLALWSMIEVQTGILATSLPILKPLWDKYREQAAKSSSPSASDSNENPYPLQYLSPTARGYSDGLATTDNESEQCMVSNNSVQTPKTPETRIVDVEEGRVRMESAGSGSTN